MAHFYNCTDCTDPSFEPEVSTPAQARKAGKKIYPSVTTVLGIIKDPFLDGIYKPRMITDLAREHPQLGWSDIVDLTYGTREHPISGNTISSSEFGTTVHHCIEQWVDHFHLGGDQPENTPWDQWAMPFLDWVQWEGVSPVACERIIANSRIKIAGSVDFIGHDSDGKLFLADYKCRTNTGGKAKTYAKDCQQLAIESFMLMKEHKLDYLPSCRSVVIDCDTMEHHHKVWTDAEMQVGIKVAKKCAELYWLTRM